MSSKKLCIDCIYYVGDRCNKTISLADGQTVDNWRSNAKLQREDCWLGAIISGTCGKTGRWFKPKD